MADPQKVVIVDGQGTRHVFPAGFDPVKAGQIVREQTESAAPAPPRTTTQQASDLWRSNTLGRSGLPNGVHGPSVDTVVDALPVAGGAVGGAVGAIPGAALGGAAGAAAKQLINRARGRNAPGTMAEAAGDIAGSAAINAAGEGVGVAAGKLMPPAASWLMEKAVAPATALKESYRTTGPKIVKTLLDEGINVTAHGVEKLQKLLRGTNDEIQAILDASPAQVDKARVLDRVQDAGQDALRSSATPQGEVAAIEKAANQFIDHPRYPGDTKLTVAEAQKMKQGIYQRVGQQYGTMKPGKIAAQKAMARGLKEEIADAVPEVAALNTRDAELMAAGEALTSRVSKDANADPLGLLFAAHNPQLFLAGLINRQPIVKSLIANGLWKMAGTTAKVSPQAIRAAVYALSSSEPAPDQK